MLCEIWYTCQDRLIINYGKRMPYLCIISVTSQLPWLLRDRLETARAHLAFNLLFAVSGFELPGSILDQNVVTV